jgi:HEAT repeat protein
MVGPRGSRPSRLPALALLLLAVWALQAGAQGAQPDPNRTLIDQWRDVLRFGIESEVLKVVQAISAGGEESLDQELVDLLRDSLSSPVRLAVLAVFTERGSNKAEPVALSLLGADQEISPELTVALVAYLGSIGSRQAEPRLQELLDDRTDRIAEAAINALAQTGAASSGQLLLERLKDLQYPQERKPELILALGKLRYAPATGMLLEILESRDADRIWRMYAATALGDIGDAAAVAPLKSLFAEEDSLLRAYAAAALSKFSMADVEGVLQQGLRDSNVKVRLAAAQALANKQARGSVEILIYKARNDPERAVRLQAIASLGEIGTAFAFLRELYADSRWLPEYREAALKALCSGDLAGSLETIRRTIDREWAAKDQKGIELTARQLAAIQSSVAQMSLGPAGELRDLYAHLLDSGNLNVRIYALRGIENNRVTGLRGKLESMAATDPSPAARRLAAKVLERL